MANSMFQNPHNFHRKAESRRIIESKNAPSSAQVRANEAMHDEIAERARTSRNMRAVTKVDSSMSREEIIAKIMGSARKATISR